MKKLQFKKKKKKDDSIAWGYKPPYISVIKIFDLLYAAFVFSAFSVWPPAIIVIDMRETWYFGFLPAGSFGISGGKGDTLRFQDNAH